MLGILTILIDSEFRKHLYIIYFHPLHTQFEKKKTLARKGFATVSSGLLSLQQIAWRRCRQLPAASRSKGVSPLSPAKRPRARALQASSVGFTAVDRWNWGYS